MTNSLMISMMMIFKMMFLEEFSKIKVDIFLSGEQFCIFFWKLVRDIAVTGSNLTVVAQCTEEKTSESFSVV